MVRAKTIGSVLFLALAAACAGPGKQQVKEPAAQAKTANGTAVAKGDQKVICRMERPTGSNIPERVCRYPDAQTDEGTMRTQDMMREAQSHTGPSPRGN
ncbi:MAG: hypothetical protein ACXWLR_01040 [Myxococcales bacterium]